MFTEPDLDDIKIIENGENPIIYINDTPIKGIKNYTFHRVPESVGFSQLTLELYVDMEKTTLDIKN